jgi:hypothetical protein
MIDISLKIHYDINQIMFNNHVVKNNLKLITVQKGDRLCQKKKRFPRKSSLQH